MIAVDESSVSPLMSALQGFIASCVTPYANKVAVLGYRPGFHNNKMHRIEWANDTHVKAQCYPGPVTRSPKMHHLRVLTKQAASKHAEPCKDCFPRG